MIFPTALWLPPHRLVAHRGRRRPLRTPTVPPAPPFPPQAGPLLTTRPEGPHYDPISAQKIRKKHPRSQKKSVSVGSGHHTLLNHQCSPGCASNSPQNEQIFYCCIAKESSVEVGLGKGTSTTFRCILTPLSVARPSRHCIRKCNSTSGNLSFKTAKCLGSGYSGEGWCKCCEELGCCSQGW